MTVLTMQFPLSREIMTTVRLATGGVCSLCGMDLSAAEDCKVCVTESLLLLMHGGCGSVRAEFRREDKLRVEFYGAGGGLRREKTVEEEISAALLSALVDDLTIEEKEGGVRVAFAFGAP